MEIEVIVQNGKEARQAEKLGADRLELVSAISEGGLTPSYGTIKQVLEQVSIPVFIMIRPHSYHYFYEKDDLEIIQEDIKAVSELGGTNIVFGALNQDYTVNEQLLENVIAIAPHLKITFHRAFDETASLIEAYRTLAKYSRNVKAILTSGGAADCLTGQQNLAALVKESKMINGPQIMPGSGLSLNNIRDIHRVVGAEKYHFGKAVRVDQSFAKGFDKQNMKDLLASF